MRRESWLVAGLLAAGLAAEPATALERRSGTDDGMEQDSWKSSSSCTLRYYNNCVGWVWVWSHWCDGERLGTVFHTCCQSAVLQLTNYLTFSGAPMGWGFTGTIEVYQADANDCPTGPPLARQPWYVPRTSGWHAWAWNSTPVPSDFIVMITWGVPPPPCDPVSDAVASDRPAGGPTGPQACGVCYPTTRQTRTYSYGTRTSPLCPGSPIHDGVCDVELVCDAVLNCPVSTQEGSWGKIKGLYR